VTAADGPRHPRAGTAADGLVPPAGDGADDAVSLARTMLGTPAAGPPAGGLRRLTGGRPIGPLAVMFALAFTMWADRAAVLALLPEIERAVGLNDLGVTALSLATVQLGIVFTIPLALRADQGDRVRIMLTGAVVFTLFSVATALVPPFWWALLLVRAGAALGLATVLSTHFALLADYYDIAHRVKVYAAHGAAMGLGSIAGLLVASWLGERYGWRAPYLVIAVPTLVVVLVGTRLRDPDRGHFERTAMGVSAEALDLREEPPTFEESQRIVQRIESLRRLFFAMPFLAVAIVGFSSLATLLYEREFGVGPLERWRIEELAALGQLAGIVVAAVIGTRLLRRDPASLVRVVLVAAVGAGVFAAALAAAPNLALAVVARIGLSAMLAAILPTMFSVLSLAVPARARSTGFSVAVVYLMPGLLILTVTGGWVAETYGIRWGVAVMAPVLALGGWIASTVQGVLDRDIRNVWTTTAARAELQAARRRGEIKQLLVRGLDVRYGDVQILFGVDFEVERGQIIALLGTNGAGKSTLLKAITGVVPAANGAIVFEGRDITSSPPHEIAGFGMAMVPGGQGVFPSLTVAENLRVASWGSQRQARATPSAGAAGGVERVLSMFPILRERLADPAANLSGGQQQMLALGMAFLSQPKMLLIDELSLGLAPVVIEQLLGIVRAIRDQGTTIILVEQSVNLALTLAETAYFMEKGEIRFHGPTAALLERPDVLRSVFLEGAASHLATVNGEGDGNPAVVTARASRPATVPRSGPAELELAHVSVRFGGILAVDDVSLAVAPGEILGIIGPNGAGKTTMFDIISGFTRADGGRVMLAGRDVTGLTPDRRARLGLGRSFQDARLFPAMTVEETIKVAFERFIDARDPFNAMLRLPVQQNSEHALSVRVDELVELLGIEAFRSKFVRELSTGSRRIVDLACVLAQRPSVVLLDEPSSGIAQRESEALAPLITRIRDTLGASILIIEHDMPLVTAAADRLLALDQGHVVVDGDPHVVLNHPDVVASYLGDREDVVARSGQRAP
jgi:branched-chain amino acid transport system ATP-binding protein